MKTENLKKAYEAIKSGQIIDCKGCRIWAGPMCYLGATEVLMADSLRAALVRSDKGVCLLMPVMQPDTFSEDNPNNIVL